MALIFFLGNKLAIKDLGPLSYFLGIEASYSSCDIRLCQKHYILSLLKKVKMDTAKSVTAPMPQHAYTFILDCTAFCDHVLYRIVVGALE